MTSILGVGEFDRVGAALIEVQLCERTCRGMSLADLILAKEALGREKDFPERSARSKNLEHTSTEVVEDGYP